MLAIGGDNTIIWDDMTDPVSGAYINDATVTFDLLDNDGDLLLNDVSMPYVSGSAGKYAGTIDVAAVTLQEITYSIEITAVAGARNGFRVIKEDGENRGHA